MRLALVNLDNGLFKEKSGWTAECGFADVFYDLETVAGLAIANRISNAAATILEGDPVKALGFIWLTNPN